MRSDSKLLKMLDSLDSYEINDTNEDITIDFIQVFGIKKDVQVIFCNLPDKSFKMFSVNDVIIGYLYFEDKDCICDFHNFFDNYDDDAEKDRVSKLLIEFVNKDPLSIKIYWNSLFYELDDNHFIMLFAGQEIL